MAAITSGCGELGAGSCGGERPPGAYGDDLEAEGRDARAGGQEAGQAGARWATQEMTQLCPINLRVIYLARGTKEMAGSEIRQGCVISLTPEIQRVREL